ncbi:MAG: ATPase P, partial [Bacteroidetes bacterium]|nr:ATPase P [Bacteroidota bacterium]
DTFGTAERELSGINCILNVLSHDLQDMQKESYVFNLGENHVIAIGNGLNDALMVKCAALGIVVVQKEGASMETLLNADIVCTNILDAFELLLNPQRIVATLRK